jgi:hypothetical protein
VKKVIRKFGSSFTPSLKDALEGNSTRKKNRRCQRGEKYYISEDLEEPFTQEHLKPRRTEFLSR